MTASPPLLARRTVNELGEAVETRALTPSEREPQDGDVLSRKSSPSHRYEMRAFCSLDGGFWYVALPHGGLSRLTKSKICDPAEGFYYVSRFDGEPVAVELYPPRPMLLSERFVHVDDTFEADEGEVGDGTLFVVTAIPWDKTDTGWFKANQYYETVDEERVDLAMFKHFRYVSRADGGPVTVSTRPKDQGKP